MKTFLIIHFREIRKKAQWGKSVEFIIDEFREKHAGLFVLVRNREVVAEELAIIDKYVTVISKEIGDRTIDGEEFGLIFLQTL